MRRPSSNVIFGAGTLRKKKNLMLLTKKRPELTALIMNIASDIRGKYTFKSLNPRDSGRNKILAAEKFSKDVRFRRVLLSQIIDILSTGEAFAWKAMPDSKEVYSLLRKIVSKEVGYKGSSLEDMAVLRLIEHKGRIEDEAIIKPRRLMYMASSTVSINHDEHVITGYTQTVQGKHVDYSPQEIIHLDFLNVDGAVDGFTPVESLVLQIELLWMMWQNQLALQKKGRPDKIISLLDVNPNSPAYERIQNQLLKYNIPRESHGILLTTGKITINDLEQIDALQFRDVGLYVTSLIAMSWQFPARRLPLKTSEASKGGDSSGSSERGYWLNIEHYQDTLADIYNSQLWEPFFGVRMVFDKSYLHDEVVENTAKQINLDNILRMNTLLAKHGKVMTQSAMLREIGLKDDDIEDLKSQSFGDGITLGLQGGTPPSNLAFGQDQINKNEQRSREQNNNPNKKVSAT